MIWAVILSAVVATVVASTGADANVGPSCLVEPLPNAPLEPFAFDSEGDGRGSTTHFEVWRQPCADDSGLLAVLIRMTPLNGFEDICYIRWRIIQNGIQMDADTRDSPTGASFCQQLLTQTTLILVSPKPFDESGAFTLVYKSGDHETPQVSLPAIGPHPPSIQVLAKGCKGECQVGFQAAFSARVTNTGDETPIMIRGGVRLPDGQVIGLLSEDLVFPAGQVAEFDIFSGVVPPDLPPGLYVVEAAIIEPTLGATISRHSVLVTLTP